VYMLLVEGDGLPFDSRDTFPSCEKCARPSGWCEYLTRCEVTLPPCSRLTWDSRNPFAGIDEIESIPVRCRKYGNEIKKLPSLWNTT
jgi:hypothetical protein